jgi:cell division protein FtsL
MFSCKEIVLKNGYENSYHHHNNVRINLLTYNGILLSIADYAKREKIKSKKIDNYVNQKFDYPSDIKETIADLEKYEYIYDYAKEKVKAITR